MRDRVTLKEAIKFHGHLGPYLVLGVLAGELALKELNAKKYFGIDVKVSGADKKPKSCLVDGLQLSCGATYGKGNIRKIKGKAIQISFLNLKNNNKLKVSLANDIVRELDILKGHTDSERFARKLYLASPLRIFNLNTDY